MIFPNFAFPSDRFRHYEGIHQSIFSTEWKVVKWKIYVFVNAPCSLLISKYPEYDVARILRIFHFITLRDQPTFTVTHAPNLSLSPPSIKTWPVLTVTINTLGIHKLDSKYHSPLEGN